MAQKGIYEVALQNGTYFIKLSGYLSFNYSAALSDLVTTITQGKDTRGVMVDLREAKMIDSTHLGLVARLAIETQKQIGQQITIISSVRDVTQSLKNTGLQHLALLLDAPSGDMPAPETIKALPESKRNVAEIILEAHKTLLEINDDNKAIYQDIVEMLETSMGEKPDS